MPITKYIYPMNPPPPPQTLSETRNLGEAFYVVGNYVAKTVSKISDAVTEFVGEKACPHAYPPMFCGSKTAIGSNAADYTQQIDPSCDEEACGP